jgi:putative SOS response-associated peptidase YedK
VGLLTWGLVPGWVAEPGAGIINARAESVADKPSFREAFERRRCLVPADGFYEWRKEAGASIPHWIHARDGRLIAFAGIWERWKRPGLDSRYTFAILTTDASADVVAIHDRMPVVVAADDRALWLDRLAQPAELRALLRPAPAGSLVFHPVSPRVNRPSEDDPGLLEPA